MTTLRRPLLEDLPLRGLAPKTQQWYVAAVHQLAQHYRRPPDQLSEEELRQYSLSWLNAKKVAESTFRIHLYGIRCFYELTLKRPWPVFDLVRPRNIPKGGFCISPRIGVPPDMMNQAGDQVIMQSLIAMVHKAQQVYMHESLIKLFQSED